MTFAANPLISVVMPVYNALPFLDDSCIYRGKGEWGRDGIVDAKEMNRVIVAGV